MVFTKSKGFEILQNSFYILVLLFSVVLMGFKIHKSDFLSLWNRICYISVKMSIPGVKPEYKICNSNLAKEENEQNKNDNDEEESESDEEDFKDEDLNNDGQIQETLSKKKVDSKCLEIQMGKNGIKCGNFFVKNKTGKEINFENYLSKTPNIKLKNKKFPTVLIYHTHTSEGYFDVEKKTRTQDKTKNVVAVGNEIVQSLEKNGIKTIHDETVHDFPNYNGAYVRSAKTVKENLKKNPEIQIAIDIHRDSMGDNITGRVKPTFKTKIGQKAAQIMFVAGCGINKSLNFPNWERNLTLALNLQSVCEKCFPGLTREFLIKNSKYNQNLTPGSILIEIGSDANSIQEAKISAKMLGEAISIFLKRFLK